MNSSNCCYIIQGCLAKMEMGIRYKALRSEASKASKGRGWREVSSTQPTRCSGVWHRRKLPCRVQGGARPKTELENLCGDNKLQHFKYNFLLKSMDCFMC